MCERFYSTRKPSIESSRCFVCCEPEYPRAREQAAPPPPPKSEAPPRTHTPAPPTRVPPRAQLPNTVSLPRGDGYQIQYLSRVQLNGHQLTHDIVPR